MTNEQAAKLYNIVRMLALVDDKLFTEHDELILENCIQEAKKFFENA